MKIDIDDEMLAAIEEFEKELGNPIVDQESAERFESIRRDVLSKLISKVNAEKMYQRIAD